MVTVQCPLHKFDHVSGNNGVITGVHSNYNYSLIKFTLGENEHYGNLRSYINTNLIANQYAIEMAVECADGFSLKNHATFKCEKKIGVIVTTSILSCLSGTHMKSEVLSNKVFDMKTICCIIPITKLTLLPNLEIGGKCMFREKHFKKYVGVCRYFGKINNVIECVGIETTEWISNECNGYCMGIKIFDCQDGHGIILRSSDIELDTTEIELNQNGLVLPRNIYVSKYNNVKTNEQLQIKRRAEVLLIENKSYGPSGSKLIFGKVKWLGMINKGMCVGVELDYRCDAGMNGVISNCESFDCEPGHGILCSIESIVFDSYIYSTAFTVNESYNIDSKLNFKEDWNQDIVLKRDLQVNTNVYVYIEKCDRIFDTKGFLKWIGYIRGVSVGILEMDDEFPYWTQPKVDHILKDAKPLSHIIVHTQYLFKYRTIKCYEKKEEDILNIDNGCATDFGILKWKGVDNNDNIYYGFQMESPSQGGTNGMFIGQQLFQCFDGFGVLISAKTVRESMLSKTNKDNLNSAIIPFVNQRDFMSFLIIVANKGAVSSEELLSSAMSMENKGILAPLIDCMTSSINIYKYPDVIAQLLKSRSFDTLELAVDQCNIDADNDKQLLLVAAESLKEGNTVLFSKCMNKCTNKDTLMDNGETFVTHIINEKLNQSLIIIAIEGYEFDITKSNNDNCVPLTLACGKMMIEVVDCIVKHIKTQEIRKKTCSICMDRDINIVFNCGHNVCKECSDKITQCHICKEKIISRGILFFN